MHGYSRTLTNGWAIEAWMEGSVFLYYSKVDICLRINRPDDSLRPSIKSVELAVTRKKRDADQLWGNYTGPVDVDFVRVKREESILVRDMASWDARRQQLLIPGAGYEAVVSFTMNKLFPMLPGPAEGHWNVWVKGALQDGTLIDVGPISIHAGLHAELNARLTWAFCRAMDTGRAR
jgi:hypothetical protein